MGLRRLTRVSALHWEPVSAVSAQGLNPEGKAGTPHLRRQAVPACFPEGASAPEGKAGRLTYVGKPSWLAARFRAERGSSHFESVNNRAVLSLHLSAWRAPY
jgi:hypothetical protein